MKPSFTYASRHPSIADDRAFFAANPHRRFRARLFLRDEIELPQPTVMFACDERGGLGEVNLVVLKRIRCGRLRYHFNVLKQPSLNTDAKIKAFLRSRGISPSANYPGGRRS